MRLLAIPILTVLVVTGCAPTASTGRSGQGAPPSAIISGTAIGSTAATSTAPTGSGSTAPADNRCPAQLDEGQYNGRNAKPVPDSIEVDWVLRCSVTPQADGRRFLLAERSDSDPAALLAALRAPDEPRSSGVCPLARMLLPYFALVRPDGTALEPKVPLTGCGVPQAAVLKALAVMRFHVIGRTQLP